MDRREALKRVALLMGGTLSSSLVSGVLAGCKAGPSTPAYVFQTLTAPQADLMATLAELIIPTTDTPGARAAGVHEFIDRILTGYVRPEEKATFIAGLTDVDVRAGQVAAGQTFVQLSPEQQTSLLQTLENEARTWQETRMAQQQVTQDAESGASARRADQTTPFFTLLKALTLTGYYTSEIGASQELTYLHVSGTYRGDISVAEAGGKAYA
jgi:hypothetical protein